MCECKRTLKNDGLASHRVDLKDHLRGSLNNLRLRREIWESNLFEIWYLYKQNSLF